MADFFATETDFFADSFAADFFADILLEDLLAETFPSPFYEADIFSNFSGAYSASCFSSSSDTS